MERSLRIALVTPFAWDTPSAVNQHVADLAIELKLRGHLPVIVASSDDPHELKRMRALFRRSRGRVLELLSEYAADTDLPELLVAPQGLGPLDWSAGVPMIPVGHSFAVRINGSVASLGLPVDVTSRMERLLAGAAFDLVHVHEPIAPSLSFTALREARSPVVCTFHLTPLGEVAYELGQSVLDRFFERLDARIVTFSHGAEMMRELYDGEYQVVPCGTRLGPSRGEASAPGQLLEGVPQSLPGGVSPSFSGPATSAGTLAPATEDLSGFALYVYRGDGRRAYRALLRSLAGPAFPGAERVVVAVHGPSADRWLPRPVPRRLRSRVVLSEFVTPEDLVPLYHGASVTILPYLGGEWLCATAAEAAACGCPVVGPDLAPMRDFLRSLEEERGVAGAVFSPGETESMRAAMRQVLSRTGAGAEVAEPGASAAGEFARRSSTVGGPESARHAALGPRVCSMAQVAGEVERIYVETLKGIGPQAGRATRPMAASHSTHARGIAEEPSRRWPRHMTDGARREDWINADLHVHSNYSKDCASSIESILATAREIGLGALAIADHNEVEGAFLARELSGGDPFVIVAEEVKTSGGEVIGLFLKEAVPKGLSFDDTLSCIKDQGGLVYVPHPFDRLHVTPSYRALVDNLYRIAVIETYNARGTLSTSNLAAERVAAKYNVVAGAGSDAHVLQGLGTAMLRMPRFSDPEGFMAALWEADIIARRKNLLYLQSLKLLQTTLDRVLPEE